MRLRIALLGLPYGDQALFVRRPVFSRIGGYHDLPLMEDIDFVRRVRTNVIAQRGDNLGQRLPYVFEDVFRLGIDSDRGTNRVLAQTLEAVNAEGLHVSMLESWADVDSTADLARLMGANLVRREHARSRWSIGHA